MSFTALTSTETEVGKPVTATLLNKVKDNFDDHESRIQSVEGGGNVAYPPIILRVGGNYSAQGAQDAILKTTCNFDLTITGIRLIIDTAGSANTTEIDIQKKSGVSAYTSVLTTRPSVASSSGNDFVSSNAVLDPTKVNCLAGDFLRLDLKAVQTNGNGFMVRIDYVKT